MSQILNFLFWVFLLFQENNLEGHWIMIDHEIKSSCTEELIFKPNGDFNILKECFDENEIFEVADGSYLTDGPVLYLNGLIFSSRVSDYYTQEYTKIEWSVNQDTLKLKVYRFESEDRYFVRY